MCPPRKSGILEVKVGTRVRHRRARTRRAEKGGRPLTATTSDTETPRLYRSTEDRLAAGVAAGLAAHLGIDRTVVRLALLALGMAGIGLAIYIALIFLVPEQPAAEEAPDGEGLRAKGRDLGQMLGYLALAAALGALFLLFGRVFDPVLWFAVFGALGAVVLWRQGDPATRDEWVSSTRLIGGRNTLRAGAGVVLIIVGVIGFLVFRQELNEARQGLSATIAILVGAGLITLPWIVRLVRERDRERQERIRSQERAELAAHIHDSVLHTLALIQRRADDSREVQRLARVQERALRSWLYQRPADAETTVNPALERVAAEVEEAHGVPIEVVCVGDCPIDDDIRAMLQAAREAMVNAAKYAGVDTLSVFGEVDEEEVLVFVRDRGKGFDLAEIPEDRMGVRGSILGRMERHGGGARIRTAPGEGTEIQLRMPRTTGA